MNRVKNRYCLCRLFKQTLMHKTYELCVRNLSIHTFELELPIFYLIFRLLNIPLDPQKAIPP